MTLNVHQTLRHLCKIWSEMKTSGCLGTPRLHLKETPAGGTKYLYRSNSGIKLRHSLHVAAFENLSLGHDSKYRHYVPHMSAAKTRGVTHSVLRHLQFRIPLRGNIRSGSQVTLKNDHMTEICQWKSRIQVVMESRAPTIDCR